MQGFIILAIIATEKHTSVFYVTSWNLKYLQVKGTGSMCMLVEHVKNNDYKCKVS